MLNSVPPTRFAGVTMTRKINENEVNPAANPMYMVDLTLTDGDATHFRRNTTFYSSPRTPMFMVSDPRDGGMRYLRDSAEAQTALDISRQVQDEAVRANLVAGIEAVSRRNGFTIA